ncbi:FkbM family methyltransferase [Polynucleobacter paneuropaeus]|nr:FkbM family methyltransferase [Polynucleobacter paneuropaeus]
MKTISLADLLIKHNAPKVIDYLSIDTEGSEYEILSHFDFESHQINIITIEHNYTEMREKIYNLLVSKGYKRKYLGLSKWDDWYVRQY